MVRKLLYAGAGWLALAVPHGASAQVATTDSAAVASALAAATHQYHKAVQSESALFDGPEYVNRTLPGTIGHPFFLGTEPQLGTATYQGGYFTEVPLSYDLALDQVVMTYANQAITIALVPEKLTAFSMGSHQFVRVLGDSVTKAVLPTGYYEVLQAGPVSLLARHTKRTQQTTMQQNLRIKFEQFDQLIARTDRTAVEVTSLKSLLSLLPAHQTEVQHYARQQKLRFGAAQREASALSALRYYYSLPQ